MPATFTLLMWLPIRFCLCLCLLFPLCLRAQTLGLSLEAIDHPVFSASGVVLNLARGGAASLDVASLSLGTHRLENVRLRCATFFWHPPAVRCQKGSFQLGSGQPLSLDWQYRTDSQQFSFAIHEGELATLARMVPDIAAWQPAGRFGAQGRFDAGQMRLQISLQDARFGNAAGTQAGEKINARLRLKAVSQKPGWHWQTELDWPQGELYVAPVYRTGAMQARAEGSATEQAVDIKQAVLTLADIGTVRGALRWQRGGGGLQMAEFSTGPLDLARILPQLLQPFIDAQAGPKVTATGTAQLSAALDAQGIHRLDAALTNVSLSSGSHVLQGITAQIPWRRDARTTVDFRAEGGQFGAIPLGAFSLPLVLQGESIDLPRGEIPLLDGRLVLEDFHADRQTGQWQWRLGGALEPVAMSELSRALGWPAMAGVLSAAIPRIRYADAILSLEGQWMVSLFDGYLAIDGLNVVEPFGKLPRLQGNIEARHLDLGMLTKTYAFGDISGYLDADIQGLEMAGTRPLAFDAHLRSTPGDYRKRISQRAVQNISSLGGAGAAAAIQRSFLSVFETFGYERIGLRCRLENGVCQMGGVETAATRFDELAGKLGIALPGRAANLPATGFVLVQGGGLPSLNVIGYNRRVDWDELVARLKAAIASNGQVQVR